MWVFKGITLGKWTKRKTFNRTPLHFRRFNLSLMSCSPAELTSVSIEQRKFHFNQLYLQTVEKVDHLPNIFEITNLIIVMTKKYFCILSFFLFGILSSNAQSNAFLKHIDKLEFAKAEKNCLRSMRKKKMILS